MSRCDGSDNNDGDPLVTLAPGTSALALGGLLLDAQELPGRPVDVVPEASLPKNNPSRSAVSAVMGRWPLTNSLILLGETSMSDASWRALMPTGFMKSSSRISPG